MRVDHVFHVGLVGVGADARNRPVAILDVVVTPRHLVVLYLGNAPGVQIALDFARLGIHQGFFQALFVADVTGTLSAGELVDVHRAWIGVKGLRTAKLDQ